MSERPKLPKYIVVLNIIMIIIILVICALIFVLIWSSKDLGWTVPTASDNSASASQTAESFGSSAEFTSEITVQAGSAE